MTWLPWLSIVFSLGTPLLLFVGRNWLKARIEKGVQHHFDTELEVIRADFRASEERLKSSLRDRESEIATLRNTVLTGSAGRQTLLDKRRFEAVEKVWTTVNDMARLKSLSAFMAIMKIDAVSKEVHDQKMQQVLTMIGAGTPDVGELKNPARDERPFLPELAWAYFQAYSTILYSNFLLWKFLRSGIGEPDKYLTRDGVKKILKAALPHQVDWIDKVQPEQYHYLLEELEENLIRELRKILDGQEADQLATARAKGILSAINAVDVEKVEKAASGMSTS